MNIFLNRISLLCLVFLISTNKIYPQGLLAGDYRIFQGTSAWELAKAINKQDTITIRNLVHHNSRLLNATDPKYGQTLLGLAVADLKYNSVKTLVDLGANVNAFNNFDGHTPLMEAIELGGNVMDNDPRYLRLLLKHGGNPNLESKYVDYGPNPTSPILIAVSAGNLEYYKILVGAGANVSKGKSEILFNALISASPDLVLYLLNNGFDCQKPMHVYGMTTSVSKMLRDWNFDLNSEAYKKKMQIVELLKEHGIDYRKEKIPKNFDKLYSQDYLDKY